MMKRMDGMQEQLEQHSVDLDSSKSRMQFKIQDLELRVASVEKRSICTEALQQSVQKQFSQGVAKCREEVQVVRNEQTTMTNALTTKMNNLNHSVGQSLTRTHALEPRMAALESGIKSVIHRHSSFVSEHERTKKEQDEAIARVLDLAHDAQSKIDSFGRRKYGGGWNVGLGR